jgi:putative membrane protein
MPKLLRFYIVLFVIGLLLSAIQPKEYFTWFLEVLPAIVGFVVLVVSYKRFAFTKFTYGFILLHCYILFIGGHYTYAEVPPFEWLKEVLHQSRNNYDKVGHFMQGFVPAMVIRELFIRKQVIAKQGYLNFIVVAICLAISA